MKMIKILFCYTFLSFWCELVPTSFTLIQGKAAQSLQMFRHACPCISHITTSIAWRTAAGTSTSWPMEITFAAQYQSKRTVLTSLETKPLQAIKLSACFMLKNLSSHCSKLLPLQAQHDTSKDLKTIIQELRIQDQVEWQASELPCSLFATWLAHKCPTSSRLDQKSRSMLD